MKRPAGVCPPVRGLHYAAGGGGGGFGGLGGGGFGGLGGSMGQPQFNSLDHLIGALLEKPRNVKAKRLGGLEIDHKLELCRLLIFTALSGWRSCGVVITKVSDHVVIFRSSPTVFADTPVPTSALTRILAGKPLRAMSSATIFLHLYRGIGVLPDCPIADRRAA